MAKITHIEIVRGTRIGGQVVAPGDVLMIGDGVSKRDAEYLLSIGKARASNGDKQKPTAKAKD